MFSRHHRAIKPGVILSCNKIFTLALGGSPNVYNSKGGRKGDDPLTKVVRVVDCRQGDNDCRYDDQRIRSP